MTVLRRVSNRFAAALAFVAIFASAFGPASSQAPASPTLWPLSYQSNGGTVVVYEPQVRTLTNYTQLAAAVVVAITLPGASAPAYGVVNFTSLVSANNVSDTVTFVNGSVNSSHWQNTSAGAALNTFAKANIQLSGHALPLATVLASLGKPTTSLRTVPVRTNPPAIFVNQTKQKAILVVIDGQPAMAPVKQTGVHYVANTNWPIFQDPASSHYYLLDAKQWLTAPALSGPWTGAVPPAAWLAKVPNTPEYADVRTKLSAPMPAPADVPKVFISNTPAELLAFDGPPQFANIPGTHLRYVSNTTSDVFFSRDTTVWYVLLAGRWYSAANLNGPWTYASGHLPADFSKIPPDSPRARVLVSIPGTNASIFAIEAANVPHLQPVDTSKMKLTVAYDPGAPQFEPIAGTPLARAVNTSVDVVKVNDKLYFACKNAVWYTAASATGPWSVATYVPNVIYTIPPNSPLYRDTYVYVYDAAGRPVHSPPTPRPEATYEKLAASQISNGDIAAGYTGYMNGYIGGYYGGPGGGYVTGTGYYTPGYFNGGVWYANPYTFGTYDQTTFARQQELGPNGGANGNSAHFDPNVKSYVRSGTTAAPVDPTPRLHASPTAVRPDNNVYAGTLPDNGVYRNENGAWQSLAADGTWAPISPVPESVQKDYKFRVDGYNAHAAK